MQFIVPLNYYALLKVKVNSSIFKYIIILNTLLWFQYTCSTTRPLQFTCKNRHTKKLAKTILLGLSHFMFSVRPPHPNCFLDPISHYFVSPHCIGQALEQSCVHFKQFGLFKFKELWTGISENIKELEGWLWSLR